MRRPFRRHLLFWAAAGLGAALDQATKTLVERRFPHSLDEPTPLVPWLFGIFPHRNDGALFGLGSSHPGVLVAVSFVAMGVIVWLFLSAKPHRAVTDVALALMMAGAVGNVIDRLVLGQVRDFLKFLFWPRYPVFNLADVWLTLGVGLMLVAQVVCRKEPAARGAASAS